MACSTYATSGFFFNVIPEMITNGFTKSLSFGEKSLSFGENSLSFGGEMLEFLKNREAFDLFFLAC